MLFSSIGFLFVFLPTVLAVYHLAPRRWNVRNAVLLAASLFFYACGEPRFVLAMVASILFNYLAGLALDRTRGIVTARRPLLVLTLAGNLGLIGVFKYANFITAALREWFPSWQGIVPQTSFLLPIGISFFTFQAISYVVDVFRGDVPAERNPMNLALYISLFPQLVAGPIVRYSTVREQIGSRETSWERFSSGVFRFVVGFNKKMLIANPMAEFADRIFAGGVPDCPQAWLGALAYTFQIYFDFSGYSDMAIGLGRMFGFEFLENFNYPYVSRTVTEFWRRWHMSLGTWFRDYLYFPMGGSRVGRLQLLFNLAVVWLATGLWHGANWTFILWGVLYGTLIAFEKLTGWVDKVDRHSWLRAVYQTWTLLAVICGWVLFRSPTIRSAGGYLVAMFGFGVETRMSAADCFWWREAAILLVVAALGSIPWMRRIRSPRLAACGYAVQLVLFLFGISCLVMQAHNPFIYFNF